MSGASFRLFMNVQAYCRYSHLTSTFGAVNKPTLPEFP